MPLSFAVWPQNYFEQVPWTLQAPAGVVGEYVADCDNAWVAPTEMQKYKFQSERLMTTNGLNIYDGGMWCIAQALLGNHAQAKSYMASVLLAQKTFQSADIRANEPCSCGGDCGYCYGDQKLSPGPNYTFFFRSIGDYLAVNGTVDERCPNFQRPWKWNDWLPVLGENAWASLLGPITAAVIASGNNPATVPANSTEIQLATRIIPALLAMRAGDTGGVYYAPHGVNITGNPNAASSVSTENQASLLAGLRAFQWVLRHQEHPDDLVLVMMESLIAGLEKYLLSSWDPNQGIFRSGFTYDYRVNSFMWQSAFAVDAQTWVGAVLGPDRIDAELGAGTSRRLWDTVKTRAGYQRQDTGAVKGVGYTDHAVGDEVFSGEWTLGAINLLRMMAHSESYAAERDALLAEADYMRLNVEAELLVHAGLPGSSTSHPSVLYANRRYFIPFGWFSNSIPALSSTAWAVAVDRGFNPLMATGAYSVKYPDVPSKTLQI